MGDEARCGLAGQQQRVIGSLLSLFPDAVQAHCEDARGVHQPPQRHSPLPDDPVLIAPLIDITDDGRAIVDERQRAKQPDWTFDESYSGQSPADRLDQRLQDAANR